MRSAPKFLVASVAASLLLTACGSSNNSKSSTQASAPTASATPASSEANAVVVKTASNAALGSTVLVNAQGMTLYRLSGEHAGKFICTSSACLHVWHPVTGSTAAASATVSSLGTVTRSDGTVQVTYKGMPLYTFSGDQGAGEDKGQGIKDVGTWNAVVVSAPSPGSAPPSESTPAPAPAPAAPASSGGGYGY